MNNKSVNGAQMREMIVAGAAMLEYKRAEIDALNVFPVPDGDTGTNMSLTMKSAVKEVNAVKDPTVANVAAALAKGALNGARGNSGVILSQLFRGFANSLQKSQELDGTAFAHALRAGSDMAYKSMMKPKEGTILTVARVIGDESLDFIRSNSSLYDAVENVLKRGKIILDKTPEMLPVLKMAGVVDAGGYGLLTIYKGFSMYLSGVDMSNYIATEAIVESNQEIISSSTNAEDIEFGYCTELFIKHLKEGVDDKAINIFRDKLDKFCDCVLVIGDYDMVKVHAHSNEPYNILKNAMNLGEITNIKIDNMREQNRELQAAKADKSNEPAKEYGFISVAVGEGNTKIFLDLNVDEVITGGQTMNPSTEDILTAIEKVNAKNIFILPNNSNIILAAQQTKELTDKNIIVIPTKSMPQGISAILGFNPEAEPEDNAETMTEMLKAVKTGQVTYAVRDSSFDGVDIKEGDMIGLFDGKIVSTDSTPEEVSKKTLDKMVDEDSGLITIFTGADVTKEKAESFRNEVAEKYSDCEVEMYEGGQPIYYYIFSVE